MKRFIALMLTLAFLCLALCSCGNKASLSSAEKLDYVNESNPYIPEKSGKDKSDSSPEYENAPTVDVEKKIVKTYSVTIETLEYDNSRALLDSLISKYGGYYSSSSEYSRHTANYDYRNGTFGIKIPSDRVESFVKELDTVGKINHAYFTSDDVTDSYYSLKSKLTALEEQESKINSMIAETKDINTLIILEDKLIEIKSQIEYVYYRIQSYDKSVDYSTVTLDLSEVVEYTEKDDSFATRFIEALKNTFGVFIDFMGEVLIVIVWVLPFAIFAGGITFLIIFLVRRKKKNK